MSEDKESAALSEKIHYGLALAEQKMLEKKAVNDEPLIEGSLSGEIKQTDPKKVLEQITSNNPNE